MAQNADFSVLYKNDFNIHEAIQWLRPYENCVVCKTAFNVSSRKCLCPAFNCEMKETAVRYIFYTAPFVQGGYNVPLILAFGKHTLKLAEVIRQGSYIIIALYSLLNVTNGRPAPISV